MPDYNPYTIFYRRILTKKHRLNKVINETNNNSEHRLEKRNYNEIAGTTLMRSGQFPDCLVEIVNALFFPFCPDCCRSV